jgi:retinol dehydrogenase-12
MNYGVNHIGHFYLTYLLWDKINQASNWKIVNVSSSAHTALLPCLSEPSIDLDDINFEHNYEQFLAYSRSKIYNILFTRALTDRVNAGKGKIFSLHPGLVRTNILRYLK